MAEQSPNGPNGQLKGLVPVPDPSLLTTQALKREIEHLRELLETKIHSNNAEYTRIREIIETRLDGMDIAIKLLQDTADKFPARIDEKITSLQQVHDQKFVSLRVEHDQKFVTLESTHGEKFNSIQTQFKERDVRTEQSSKDSKVAVDAALQAAKEAVGEQNKSSSLAIQKSETATVKQMDQLSLLIQTGNKASDEKINDVKDRITRIEGRGEGISTAWVALLGALTIAAFFLSRFVR